MHKNESFEAAWPELDRRLHHLLARKGLNHALSDDVVQETGLRLFRMWDDVDTQRGPWGLAVTIANNLVYDETCKRSSKEIVAPIPERGANDDVESSGIARLQLTRVSAALKRMNPNYRAVLLAEVGHDIPLQGNPRAVNMLRMRARQRLTALIEKDAASFGFSFPVAIKAGMARIAATLKRNHPVMEGAAAAVAAAVVATTFLLGPSKAVPRSDIEVPLDPIAKRAPGPAAKADAPRVPERSLGAGVEEVKGRAGRVADETREAAQNVTQASIGNGPVRTGITLVIEEEPGRADETPRCSTRMAGRLSLSCRGTVGERRFVAGVRVRTRAPRP